MEIRPNQEALESLVAKLRKPKEKPKTTGPKVEFKFDDSRLIDKILESQNGAKNPQLTQWGSRKPRFAIRGRPGAL